MYKLETAKILLDINAISLNPVKPYKYASGILSPIYTDCRIISSFPEERRRILEIFVEYIDQNIGRNKIDAVVGSGPSAISLTTYLSEKLCLPMAYVREGSKDHGKKNKVEGVLKENQNVIIIGDVLSTETYIQNSVETLKEMGVNIVYVLAIFSTNLGIVENFLREEGIKYHHLSDLRTLLDFAFFEKKISSAEYKTVLNWLSNPTAWHTLRFENIGEKIAKILLRIKAVALNAEEPFRYASGISSPIYCDNRLLISNPVEWEEIIESMITLIINKIGLENIDLIAGTATAGIPHAAYISERLKLPMVYVRGESSEHGKKRKVEGLLEKSQRVLVVEDLISTGGSSIKAVKAVREAGGIVENCLAIFTYEFENTKKEFDEAHCNLITLSNFNTLIKVASDLEYIKPIDQIKVMEWNKNPIEWGPKYGIPNLEKK